MHDHGHAHTQEDASPKNIAVAFVLNSVFVIIELVGGIMTNSVSILSDAVHDLGDSLSLGLAYYFSKKASKGRDSRYHYGYRRFSLLGAFLTTMILTVSSVFIISEAVRRLMNPEQPDTTGMIVLAILGVVVNGTAALRLKKGITVQEEAVSLHFIEDVLGWMAVLTGSIVMKFYDVPVLDPVLSLGITAYILWNVFKTMKRIFRIFLQSKPHSIDEAVLRSTLERITGVKEIHDLHLWTMDGLYHVITLHVVAGEGVSAEAGEEIKREVRHQLQHLNISHITIELEFAQNACKS